MVVANTNSNSQFNYHLVFINHGKGVLKSAPKA
jgi:hypothetical protein